ncbi:hypothetical protein [Flavobacterium sp.]|uniref:hypothetical protein n=1 Tax=Flavobacterium sp. TaxID=239 RepID=UPI003BC9843F
MKNLLKQIKYNPILFTEKVFLRIFLLLILIFGCEEIKAQTVIYSQGFETTNDWTLLPSVNNSGNYWVHETGSTSNITGSATHSGTKSLQIWKKTNNGWDSDYSNNATNQYNRTASKTFNFSTIPCGSSLLLKYWVLCNGERGYDDLTVSVNSNTVQGPMTGITTWQQKTIDLSAYAGNNNVIISFNWRNDGFDRNQPAARIDDIEIRYTPSMTFNAGPDLTICYGTNTQLNGSAILIGSTIPQSNLMANDVTDISNTEISVSITGAPVNATITSLTFTPMVWVVDLSSNFSSCYKYGIWVKMQYWNGATWIDIANCNQPITISNFNGNLANGTLIKIRCVNITGDYPDYVYTDLLNVVANYQFSSGITFSWSPTTGLNSSTIYNPISTPSVTTTYTMTATSGNGCSVSDDVVVTVNPKTTPTFNQVAAVCSGTTIAALPTTSNNGVTGTWSPAINNTVTTTYTFTPTAGLCANTTTMSITVNPKTTPTFTQVAAVCSGATIAALPTSSVNSVTGTWSPTINNTATNTYTFTPTSGLCANTATMIITIKENPSTTQIYHQ